MMNSQLNHPQFFTYRTGSIHILNSENRQSAAFSIIQSFFVTVRHQALISVVFLACVFLFNSGGRRAELNNTMTTIEEHKPSKWASEQGNEIVGERKREKNALWLACSCSASALWRSGKQANYRAQTQRQWPCHFNLPVRIS